MLAGIQALAPSHVPQALPRSHFPPAPTAPLRGSSGAAAPSYLTHALAIAAAPERDAPHAIFPVHAVVLARGAFAILRANLSVLMGHAGHVKELGQDMVTLGMYDAELWDALDLTWEVLGALNLAAQ
ncbi:hypothetical protein FB451DRAFT_1418918 [Mycena latifolia]|nr:hypothetical protein FB451DRAFT_1418918 [Mycena latifolia]